MTTPGPVTFVEGEPALILLPNPYPNAVTSGEYLGTVLARINAFRAPNRQIIGATCPQTGRHLPMDLRITGRLVAQEVVRNQYLQFGPTQYAAIRQAGGRA
jgi:hypothetical protein